MSSFGLFYAILLGLTAVAAYQNWSDINARVTEEAGALLSLHYDVASFDETARSDTNSAILDVVETTMGDAWKHLCRGKLFTGTAEVYDALRAKVVSYQAKGQTQVILYEQAIGNLNDFADNQRHRNYSVSEQGQPVAYRLLGSYGIGGADAWRLGMARIPGFARRACHKTFTRVGQ